MLYMFTQIFWKIDESAVNCFRAVRKYYEGVPPSKDGVKCFHESWECFRDLKEDIPTKVTKNCIFRLTNTSVVQRLVSQPKW